MARRSRLVIGSGALVGVLVALALGAAIARGDTGPPVSTVGPDALGSPGVGKTIRTTNGSWSTSVTLTYQWVRCGKGLRACAPDDPSTFTVLPNAISPTYVPVAADVGHFLAARVTATNAAGSTSVLSSELGPVEARPPGLKHKPWIGGKKKLGQRLWTTLGTWTRAASAWRLEWLRCSATGNSCTRIKGKHRGCSSCIPTPIGSDPEYKLTRKDLGHRMRIKVTAWNGAGRASAISDPTRIITK